MPSVNSTIINNLIDQAKESKLQQHLAAAVLQSNKQLSDSVCNSERNFCRGQYVPSLHAEQRAILAYYGQKVNYNAFKGWYFYEDDYKAKRLDIAVVRLFKNGKLANARPCRKCLAMMKDLGIKKVHYSSGNEKEIISENIKDMWSINDSSSIRRFDRIHLNYPKDDFEYYKFLLKKNAPKTIKLVNLMHFIRFNLVDLLNGCVYSFEKIKGQRYFKIINKDEILALIKVE